MDHLHLLVDDNLSHHPDAGGIWGFQTNHTGRAKMGISAPARSGDTAPVTRGVVFDHVAELDEQMRDGR